MQWTVDECPGPSFAPLLRVTTHPGSQAGVRSYFRIP
jgi:hypothetical protein